MFSRRFPIKCTNSRAHPTIIEGPNLFGPKSSFHFPKKPTSFKDILKKIHEKSSFLSRFSLRFLMSTEYHILKKNRLPNKLRQHASVNAVSPSLNKITISKNVELYLLLIPNVCICSIYQEKVDDFIMATQ